VAEHRADVLFRLGHVLDRLARTGEVETLRTDEPGTIEFVTDGQRLWVQTEWYVSFPSIIDSSVFVR
jgi:hypothetical protein